MSIILLNFSCRQEDEPILIGERPSLVNSNVAGLLQRTALNDGSVDNIIDRANCFTVKLPVIVKANGTDLLVDSQDDYANIEAIFDASDDDTDVLEIMFPIMIVFTDYTEAPVADQAQLNAFAATCSGENVSDDDIECIDIQYPITVAIFNRRTEVFDNLSLTSDMQLFNFIDDLESDDIVTINFPINMILAGGTEIQIGDLDNLENALEEAQDSCDEDDDFDFDDDDCDSCSTNQLAEVLTGCTNWTVDELERNDDDLEDNYGAYQFNFLANGTLTASGDTNSFSGTWESSGSANSIFVTLNIPGLNDFNAVWNLHEIDEDDGGLQVDLRLGDDRLSFESNCAGSGGNGNGSDSALAMILTDGLWVVGSYMEDTDDQTADYNGYAINFNSDGTVVADNGNTINGTWAAQDSDSELFLNFGSATPFDELNDTWSVISVSATQVEVSDMSGGDGETDTLILIKQ